MPSKWRYFCCTCDNGDTHEYRKPYVRVKVKRRTGNASGKKATWTRRSLLENEHSELQETPFDQLTDRIHSDSFHPEYNVTELQTLDGLNKHQRRTAREVFDNAPSHSLDKKTTFPWMSEEFVPNGRKGTHLGISSVQINAKRNEQANKNIAPDLKEDMYDRSRVSGKVNLKSHSFNIGDNQRNLTTYAKPMIRTNVNLNNDRPISNGYQNNVRTVPNGYGFRGNVTTVENKANTVAAHVGRSDRTPISNTSNSNVSVRVLHANSRAKDNRIPKLGDYLVLKPDIRAMEKQAKVTKVQHGGQAAVPISYKQLSENQSDVSFSSEITFRKSEPGYDSVDMSLKRSNQPTMFSNDNKYQRLKAHSDIKVPYTSRDKRGPNVTLDSMYGYIPKAVQNVHASNALSGGVIDDFRMQRMDDNELQKFASIDRKELNDWRDVMDANYIGTKPAQVRPKSVPAFVNVDQRDIKANRAIGMNTETSQNDYARIKVGLQQIRLQPPPNMRERSSKSSKHTQVKQPIIRNNWGIEDYVVLKDENQNKVIMIDFPPNLEKEKHQNDMTVKNDVGGSNNETNLARAINTDKLMVAPLSENDEVLY